MMEKVSFRFLQKKNYTIASDPIATMSNGTTKEINTNSPFSFNNFITAKDLFRDVNSTSLLTSGILVLFSIYIIKKQRNATKYKIHKGISSAPIPIFFRLSPLLEIVYIFFK